MTILLLVLILVNFVFSNSLILGRLSGLILLVVLGFYLYNMIKSAKVESTEKQEKTKFNVKDVIFVIIGLAMVVFGGDLTVDNATLIAQAWGMSERFIGLTIVAIGTSLPELVTSLVATKKGELDIAIGNVVGSNIFNMLLILGAASVINPMTVSTFALIDLIFVIVAMIVFMLITYKDKTLSKTKGLPLVLIYVVYIIFTIIR